LATNEEPADAAFPNGSDGRAKCRTGSTPSCQLTQKREVTGSTMCPDGTSNAAGAIHTMPLFSAAMPPKAGGSCLDGRRARFRRKGGSCRATTTR
jgi:hypothetical protein